MKRLLGLFMGLGLWVSQPALASSIPKAETDHTSLSLNFGPSASFDLKLAPNLTVGGSVGLPIYYILDNHYGIIRYDVRMAYQFMREGYFSLSAIVGLWGDSTALLNHKVAVSPLGLELGLALSYEFVPERLIGRLNIVPGIAFSPTQDGRGYFPPAGGIELAYRVSDLLELTIGANGNGDILSGRLLF